MMAARAGIGPLVVTLLVSVLVVVASGGPVGAAEPPPAYIATWGQSGTGNGQFREPYDVAVGPDGSVYVADLMNQRIQRFTAAGTFVTAWGTFGTGNGQFHNPYGVTVDNDGYVYVADLYNHRIQKFTPNGTFVTKWGSNGTANGQFQGPVGVAVDDDGYVYVADNYNHRIQKFTSTGVFVTTWGSEGTGNGQFSEPGGVAVDSSGNVYVADTGNRRVQKFTSTGAFVAKWGSEGTGNGQFSNPGGVAVDGSGNVYVADSGFFDYDEESPVGHRVQKFTSTGTFVTKWGTVGGGDGQFYLPRGVAVDSVGNVYVAEVYNSRVQRFRPRVDAVDPTVDLRTPAAGAVFEVGAEAFADFSCDDTGGSGLDTCVGTVANRAAIGTPGRTKVYILDEVHMLSTAASNALLKTLEEPPGHVVFILATTDPQKVLPTIKSRTQHLPFGLLDADELAEHLTWVVGDAGLDVTDEALQQVLREGAGSARDTLSALDRVAAGGGVAEGMESVDVLVDALAERDTGAALLAVAADVRRGRDPRLVGEGLLGRLRDVFLAAMQADLGHLPDGDRAVVDGYAQRMSAPQVTRALEVLGEALVEMRQAPDPRIPLEVALVRLTRVDTDTSVAALAERLERLERGGVAAAPSAAAAPARTPDVPAAASAPTAPPAGRSAPGCRTRSPRSTTRWSATTSPP